MVSINDRLAYNYSNPSSLVIESTVRTKANCDVGETTSLNVMGKLIRPTMLSVFVDKHATEQATVVLYFETTDWFTSLSWARVCNADGTDKKLIEFTVPTGTGSIGKSIDISWMQEPCEFRVVFVVTTATARNLGCCIKGFGRTWVE